MKEAAESLGVDLSDDEDDEDDEGGGRSKKRDSSTSNAGNKKTTQRLYNLQAELDSLLREQLMARGVSAKYPTSGSRVIIDDLLGDDGKFLS